MFCRGGVHRHSKDLNQLIIPYILWEAYKAP